MSWILKLGFRLLGFELFYSYRERIFKGYFDIEIEFEEKVCLLRIGNIQILDLIYQGGQEYSFRKYGVLDLEKSYRMIYFIVFGLWIFRL